LKACHFYIFYLIASLDSCLNSIKHEKVFATIGCHPHFAAKWDDKIESYIYSSLTNPKIVAIGECGLDVSRKLVFF
jgi:TatD DNase family protein